jgi:threonine aldolase
MIMQSRRMNFASDNGSGASAKILQAVLDANHGSAAAYGADEHTQRAEEMLCRFFERDVEVFLVTTGTAANALALAALTPPWGAIFAHEDAHVIEDECGAPEMFTAGAKLVGISGRDGKLVPAELVATLARYPRGIVKQTQPAALSLSQATECGTLYSCAEITALSGAAHGHGLRVHMDGSRFCNALVNLGCSAAEMTWKAGVDVLSLGTTKNGTLACEAVVFFDGTAAAEFAYRRKRAGHTVSKGRFLGAQMVAYLDGNHCLELARQANARAARLSAQLRVVDGVSLAWPTEINEVFAILPRAADTALKKAGARYHEWSARCLPAPFPLTKDKVFVRLVTSFATPEEEIERLLAIVRTSH